MKKRKYTVMVAAALTAALIFDGSIRTLAAEPESPQATVQIRHKHVGEESKEGGCYTKPVLHTHTGDAQKGGGCYSASVFHVHEGAAQIQGGCYTTPQYHSHSGNASVGGGCYTDVKRHSHSDNCYSSGRCTVHFVRMETPYEDGWDHCDCHGRVHRDSATCIFRHGECGSEDSYEKRSWTEYHAYGNAMDSYSHDYTNLICGMENGTATGFGLACGMDEGAVEAFGLSCGKTEETVVGYQTACGKTEESVERYEPGCMEQEGAVVATLRLTKSTGEWTRQVRVTASYEKKGKVTILPDCFIWNGRPPVSEQELTVTENGLYTCRLHCGADCDAGQATAAVRVDNIDRTGPAILHITRSGPEDKWTNEIVKVTVEAKDLQP